MAVWQHVLCSSRTAGMSQRVGVRERAGRMSLDVALFPDSTPTSFSPAPDMFWSSAALHPSRPITGEDWLNVARRDPQWQPRSEEGDCRRHLACSKKNKKNNNPKNKTQHDTNLAAENIKSIVISFLLLELLHKRSLKKKKEYRWIYCS